MRKKNILYIATFLFILRLIIYNNSLKHLSFMENLKRTYRNLETRVLHEIRILVENSTYKSKHHSEKAMKVNVFGYTEIALISDRLCFLCENGYHYSLFCDCTLEDLIDIINSHKS